jgi:uncharacterized protein DUF3592
VARHGSAESTSLGRHTAADVELLMFDLIATVQQVMLLIMAIAFMAIGGLLIGYDIHARVRGLRVTGTIVGVREKRPKVYHNVYRYTLPSGESVEATSNKGSGFTRGRETGRRVQLFTSVARPNEAWEAGVPIAASFGAFFFAAGLWPLHSALTYRPVTPLTGVVLVGVIALLAYRARRLVIPKAHRKTARAWFEERTRAHQAELAAFPVRRIEEVLAAPAAQAAAAAARRRARLAAPLLLITGVAAISFGVHLGRQLAHREAVGVRAPGAVVSLVEKSDSDGSSYYPVVRFRDSTGSEVRFKDRFGSNPPSYHVGDTVTVLYEREKASAAMIDRGFWNWLPASLLAALGGVFTFAGLRLLTRLD